jgi:hypothetical protein
VVELIPGTFERGNPFDTLTTDVEYGRWLRDHPTTAQAFPAVLDAQAGDPRVRSPRRRSRLVLRHGVAGRKLRAVVGLLELLERPRCAQDARTPWRVPRPGCSTRNPGTPTGSGKASRAATMSGLTFSTPALACSLLPWSVTTIQSSPNAAACRAWSITRYMASELY